MSADAGRVIEAVHGRRQVVADPDYVAEFAAHLAASYGPAGLLELYARFAHGNGVFDAQMRRIAWFAMTASCGSGLTVEPGVRCKHPETFRIGDGVFIGTDAFIQGRFDGRCEIGNRVWIGPQSYFDARDLVLEDYVGWGPGAKVLGSEHTGIPVDVPIIETDLRVQPVRVEAWADVGTGAVLLPGVTVGRGAIVGAGAVVTTDVPAYSTVAGVPARVIAERQPPDVARIESRLY